MVGQQPGLERQKVRMSQRRIGKAGGSTCREGGRVEKG